MSKVKRNLDTPESREFWESVERDVEEIQSWPHWKRAFYTPADLDRSEPWRGDYSWWPPCGGEP